MIEDAGFAIEQVSKIAETAKDIGKGGLAFIERTGFFLKLKSQHEVGAARAKAEATIEALESVGMNLSEKQVACIMIQAMQSVQGLENLEEVLSQVTISEESNISEIEDEWMATFVECAQGSYSEWRRRAVANAASQKASAPAQMSQRVLLAIARMDQRDMEAFEILCGLRPKVDGIEFDPLVPILDDRALGKVGLSVSAIRRLSEIGLLTILPEDRVLQPTDDERNYALHKDAGLYYLVEKNPSSRICVDIEFASGLVAVEPTLLYDGGGMLLKLVSVMNLGCIELTETGKELEAIADRRLCEHEKIKEYILMGYDHIRVRENQKRSMAHRALNETSKSAPPVSPMAFYATTSH